ncbi:uncharacterized protein LOC126824055 [Patella vulgata]|uniref:uncharacterized protein LOC126824055 n=1 Tax=Patella vulgata TaxID=6465 RepID=UPI00217FF253|nr:uncharacterized protein LOC126824055 [Patella vulgata]
MLIGRRVNIGRLSKMIYEVLYLMTFFKSVTCVRVELPAVYDYQLSWDVTNRTDFKFNVKAEMEARLSLDTDRPSNSDPEIIIGGMGNTRTEVFDCRTCNTLLRYEDNNPLSSGTKKYFWINLSTNKFSCGFGTLTTVDPLIDYSPFPTTNRIWISSYPTAAGSWEMPDYLTMTIPSTLLPNTTVHWDVAGITSALLSIETCGSVDLIFTTDIAGDYYQVGLGDCAKTCTTLTKFMSSSTPTTLTATENPLQCSSFADIWISWESGARKLEVGTGHVLNQNALVAMENLDDLNTIEKMEPRSTDTTQWKIDLYGCKFLSWQEWGGWSICDRDGQVLHRYRVCQCEHPPSDPNFDPLLYCNGDYREEIKSNAVVCKKWKYKGKLYSTTMDKSVTTAVSQAACMLNCRTSFPNCYYISYNKLEKLCWMYIGGIPHFKWVSNQFILNENFKTHAFYQ